MSNEYTPDPKGLYQKYLVYRCNSDGTRGEEVKDCFVMRYADPNAVVGIQAYGFAVHPENAELAQDLHRQLQRFYAQKQQHDSIMKYTRKYANATRGLAMCLEELIEEQEQQ